MRRGFWRLARWRDSTFEVIVAEKRYVRLPSRGRTLRILSMMGPKSRLVVVSYSVSKFNTISA